jgi:hypothetical protein
MLRVEDKSGTGGMNKSPPAQADAATHQLFSLMRQTRLILTNSQHGGGGGGGGSIGGGPQQHMLQFNPLHVAQTIEVSQGEKVEAVEPVASMHHQQVDRLQGAPTYLPLIS